MEGCCFYVFSAFFGFSLPYTSVFSHYTTTCTLDHRTAFPPPPHLPPEVVRAHSHRRSWAARRRVKGAHLPPHGAAVRDGRLRQEGGERGPQNYGHVVLREGYPPDAKIIKDGATAHLDSIGLKFNSIRNRTDKGGFPTREWHIGWTVTERFSFPDVARISNMKVGCSQHTTSPTHDTRPRHPHVPYMRKHSPQLCT